MTEKIARHGVRVPSEYVADFLDRLLVSELAVRKVITLNANQTIAEVRRWMATHTPEASHQGYPILDDQQMLIGVLTRRNLLEPVQDESALVGSLVQRPAITIFADATLRQAADQMVAAEVGRLPVVDRDQPLKVIGFITRSDLLSVHRERLVDMHHAQTSIRLRLPWLTRRKPSLKPVQHAPDQP